MGIVRSAEHVQPTWGKWEFHPHNTLIDFRIQKCTSKNCFTDVFSQTDFDISLDMSFCGLVTWKQDLSVTGSTDEEEPADWTPHMSPLNETI